MPPWTAACQAPVSFITLQSLLKFMSTEAVMLYSMHKSKDVDIAIKTVIDINLGLNIEYRYKYRYLENVK